eukprot:5420258-Amphidinium_carterae.1
MSARPLRSTVLLGTQQRTITYKQTMSVGSVSVLVGMVVPFEVLLTKPLDPWLPSKKQDLCNN